MSYKISINEYSKDKKELLSSKPVDQFAVVIDKTQRTSEVLDIDSIQIDAIAYSKSQGFFQVNFCLGGFDKNGKFHKAAQYQPALFAINRDNSPLWKSLDLENIQSFTFDTIEKWLHDNNAVSIAGKNVWKISSIESKENTEKKNG